MDRSTEEQMEVLIISVNLLEKRVATLEGQAQEQREEKFIPEDSNGICKNRKPCKRLD